MGNFSGEMTEKNVTSESNFCIIAIYVTVPLLFCYWILEVHYFLRFLLCAFIAKFFKRRLFILEETTYSGKLMIELFDSLFVRYYH